MKFSFEELHSMNHASLIKLKEQVLDREHELQQEKYSLIAQILFYQMRVEKMEKERTPPCSEQS